MKPVFQKIIDKGKGDCFSACIASLLEIPLEDVPKFRKEAAELDVEMMSLVRPWLAENYGLSCVSIKLRKIKSGKDFVVLGAAPGTPCIAGGKSPNISGAFHAVVGELDRKDGINFVMTHDPNPSGKGIKGAPRNLYFFIPLKPESFGKKSGYASAGIPDDCW